MGGGKNASRIFKIQLHINEQTELAKLGLYFLSLCICYWILKRYLTIFFFLYKKNPAKWVISPKKCKKKVKKNLRFFSFSKTFYTKKNRMFAKKMTIFVF